MKHITMIFDVSEDIAEAVNGMVSCLYVKGNLIIPTDQFSLVKEYLEPLVDFEDQLLHM